MSRYLAFVLFVHAASSAPTRTYRDTPSLMTYNGKVGATYNDSDFVASPSHTYAMAVEPFSVSAHPVYVRPTSDGMLLAGDGFGDGDGRGWANSFDSQASLKWAWQSNSSEFDAILGAVTLPDDTVVLGGTRSVAGRWELLLVAIQPDGTELWSTTLTPSSPQHKDCAKSGIKNCYGTIYWMDADPVKQLLIFGGVVDFPHDQGSIMWKSGGGQPDPGGVPFLAAIPFSKLATAPTNADIQTAHYFNPEPGFTTVVSLRAEHNNGVIVLLPLNPSGGSVARLTYDDAGQFKQEWITPLTVANQVTDISIVGGGNATAGYVVSATVNPGAKIEALTPDGHSAWTHDYDVASAYPAEKTPKGQRNWCQECWSIDTRGDDILLSCGVSELAPGDLNCDDGLWRSALVRFNFHQPTTAAYHVFGRPLNFATEYASFGNKGELLCAVDADDGGTVVSFFPGQGEW